MSAHLRSEAKSESIGTSQEHPTRGIVESGWECWMMLDDVGQSGFRVTLCVSGT